MAKTKFKTNIPLWAEASEALRTVMAKHCFLQPDNKNFDRWDANDAVEVVADLIIEINKSNEIQEWHSKNDWGK